MKNLDEEAEHRQAGLDKDEDLDAELEELINNQVQINDEDEQLAASKFLRDLERQDKEELKKIISGAYRSDRANKKGGGGQGFADLIAEDGSTLRSSTATAEDDEARRKKRIQEAIRVLNDHGEENQYSEGEEEDQSNGAKNKRRSKGERRKGGGDNADTDEGSDLMRIREANILLKKEFEKMQGSFDEKKLFNPAIATMLGETKKGNISQKVSEKFFGGVGMLGGGKQPKQPGTAAAAAAPSTMNAKNSVLHVKQNKNRISQFNESFNKDSMINEFGESALSKAFSSNADAS